MGKKKIQWTLIANSMIHAVISFHWRCSGCHCCCFGCFIGGRFGCCCFCIRSFVRSLSVSVSAVVRSLLLLLLLLPMAAEAGAAAAAAYCRSVLFSGSLPVRAVVLWLPRSQFVRAPNTMLPCVFACLSDNSAPSLRFVCLSVRRTKYHHRLCCLHCCLQVCPAARSIIATSRPRSTNGYHNSLRLFVRSISSSVHSFVRLRRLTVLSPASKTTTTTSAT